MSQCNNNPRTNTPLLVGSKYEKCKCAECRGTAIKPKYIKRPNGQIIRVK